MNDKECTKFVHDYNEEGVDAEHTIWAYYETKARAWIPVR